MHKKRGYIHNLYEVPNLLFFLVYISLFLYLYGIRVVSLHKLIYHHSPFQGPKWFEFIHVEQCQIIEQKMKRILQGLCEFPDALVSSLFFLSFYKYFNQYSPFLYCNFNNECTRILAVAFYDIITNHMVRILCLICQ